MTNGEWLESKLDALKERLHNGLEKFADWLWKHAWLFAIIFIVLFVADIIVSVFIDEIFAVFIVPIIILCCIFIGYGVVEWLDKEHKEKK